MSTNTHTHKKTPINSNCDKSIPSMNWCASSNAIRSRCAHQKRVLQNRHTFGFPFRIAIRARTLAADACHLGACPPPRHNACRSAHSRPTMASHVSARAHAHTHQLPEHSTRCAARSFVQNFRLFISTTPPPTPTDIADDAATNEVCTAHVLEASFSAIAPRELDISLTHSLCAPNACAIR